MKKMDFFFKPCRHIVRVKLLYLLELKPLNLMLGTLITHYQVIGLVKVVFDLYVLVLVVEKIFSKRLLLDEFMCNVSILELIMLHEITNAMKDLVYILDTLLF